MCVTVHFIDKNWTIQKRIISFACLKGRHSGANLVLTVLKVLFDWNIDKKMFSLTLDNDGANGVCVREVVDRLNQSEAICCGGKLFHVRCATHIINLVVQDGINVIKKGCDSIREVVEKVKNSPTLREEFEKRAQECKLDTRRALSLDVSTRWNSTYMMLRDDIYYREAFQRMHILNHARFPNFPSTREWQEANELCKILKNFHKVTEILSGTYPTSNLFFQKFCEIKLKIRGWLTHEDPIIVEIASLMKHKFDKYWDQSNTVLAMASFLDPRYKMGLIDFYYPRIYENGGTRELEEFKRILKDLYGEYLLKYQSSVQQVAHVGRGSVPVGDSGDGDDDGESEFNQFMLERRQPWNIKSDLDQHIDRRATLCPQGQDLDVLGWWKTEGQEYPILSKVARDVLAVPVSTVASESAFSTDGRVINAYRSKLDSEAVEALVCIQDWIRGDKKGRTASVFDFIEEKEEDGSCSEDDDSD